MRELALSECNFVSGGDDGCGEDGSSDGYGGCGDESSSDDSASNPEQSITITGTRAGVSLSDIADSIGVGGGVGAVVGLAIAVNAGGIGLAAAASTIAVVTAYGMSIGLAIAALVAIISYLNENGTGTPPTGTEDYREAPIPA
jgi:hypothetical protein